MDPLFSHHTTGTKNRKIYKLQLQVNYISKTQIKTNKIVDLNKKMVINK